MPSLSPISSPALAHPKPSLSPIPSPAFSPSLGPASALSQALTQPQPYPKPSLSPSLGPASALSQAQPWPQPWPSLSRIPSPASALSHPHFSPNPLSDGVALECRAEKWSYDHLASLGLMGRRIERAAEVVERPLRLSRPHGEREKEREGRRSGRATTSASKRHGMLP